jgi:hypothetical protein
MPIDQDAVKESDKGLMETVFGQATCQGTHGLMFIGFIAPGALSDFGKLFLDSGQLQTLANDLKKKAEERQKLGGMNPAAPAAAKNGRGSRKRKTAKS